MTQQSTLIKNYLQRLEEGYYAQMYNKRKVGWLFNPKTMDKIVITKKDFDYLKGLPVVKVSYSPMNFTTISMEKV